MTCAHVVIIILVTDHGDHWQVQGNCEVHDARADIGALRVAARWLTEEADDAEPAEA